MTTPYRTPGAPAAPPRVPWLRRVLCRLGWHLDIARDDARARAPGGAGGARAWVCRDCGAGGAPAPLRDVTRSDDDDDDDESEADA